MRRIAFAIKAEIADPNFATCSFVAQRTMYDGKHVAVGDTVFVFASEREGGRGLVARGVVTLVERVARTPGVAREPPLVSLSIRREALATRPLGRGELRHLTSWDDGQPGTEINFKFYRQATNKVVGLSGAAAAFLHTFF